MMKPSCIALAGIGFLVFACTKTPEQTVNERSEYYWSGIGFGIEMSMELYDVTEQQGETIAAETEKLIRTLEESFSLYLEKSELSQLNNERSLSMPSAEFLSLLQSAKELNSRTHGYYDPAVHGPWFQLEIHKSDPELWAEICDGASLQYLSQSAKALHFTHPKTQVSFNAIVQGYLTDRVARFAKSNGVATGLLHLGESYAIGQHPEHRPWSLAVMGTPVHGEVNLVGSIEFSDAGLAVSTNDTQRLLFNPKTQTVNSNNRVVTVVSSEGAMVADAFATALGVAPKSAWKDLYKSLSRGGQCQVKIWVENELVFEVCKELNIPSMPVDSPLQAFYSLIFNELCLIERVWLYANE